MKFSNYLIGICALFFIALPAAAFELIHDEGKVSLTSTASKIATYDLAILDSLNTLGVAVAGVPKSSLAGEPSRSNGTTVVGTLFEPDYPALKALKPDLIFAGRRSKNDIPKLQKIAPTAIFESDPSAFLDSFRRDNLALAQAFQKKEQAQKMIDAIDETVRALHEVNKEKTAAFLFVVKGNVITHAPGDRFGYAYELAGLRSVLPARNPNEAAVSRPEANSPEAKAAEAARTRAITSLAHAEPDWLIILDRSAINGAAKTAADILAKHPQLNQTKAFKEGRVFYVDPDSWYIVGGGLSNLKNITAAMLSAMK